MMIAKGSSFATWTRKLQGKGGENSKQRSKNSSQKSLKLATSPTGSLRSFDASEERGDSERNFERKAMEIYDQRDDAPPVQREDLQVECDSTTGSGHSRSEYTSRLQFSSEHSFQDYTYEVGPGVNREKDVDDNLAPVSAKEPYRETLEGTGNSPEDQRELSSDQVGTVKVNEDLIKASDCPKRFPTKVAIVKTKSPVVAVASEMGLLAAQGSDTISMSRYDSDSASTNESQSSTTLSHSESEIDESALAVSQSALEVPSGISTEEDNQNGGSTSVSYDQYPTSSKSELSGKHAIQRDQADVMSKLAVNDYSGEFQVFGNEPTDNNHHHNKETGHSLQNQEQTREDDGGNSLSVESKDAELSIATMSAKPSEATSAGSASSGSRNVLEEEARADKETEPSTTKISPSKQNDRPPLSSESKACTDSEESGPETVDNDDTVDATETAFESQEGNTHYNNDKTRRFSKTKLASWASLKRLTKNDKITEQEGAPDTKALSGKTQATKGQAKTKEESNRPSLKMMTMKNRMRQEKRALGRVKQKQRKLKNSLVGVGEIISAVGGSSSPVLPLSPGSSINNRVPLSPNSLVPPETRASPKSPVTSKSSETPRSKLAPSLPESDEKMLNAIWWSNEKQCVEIIAVKSSESAKEWNEEGNHNKRDKSRHWKNKMKGDSDTDENGSLIERDQDDADENEFSPNRLRLSSSKAKATKKREKGKVKKPKSVNHLTYEGSAGTSKFRRRERLREKKRREKAYHSKRALASMSTDLSENEHCACNEEVIEEGRVLCGNGEAEEAGCRGIRYDLREMAKELLRQGPKVMVAWLE